jgi:alanine-synthesizing transaminase
MSIDKSTKLDNVRYDIRGPVLDEATRMEAQGANILHLNIGNPAPHELHAPDEIIVDMIYNLRSSEGYSSSKGLFSARKAVMQYCQTKNIPNVGIEDIYMGNGASEMISLSLSAMLNTGDEVLVPMPDYPLWTASVMLGGGKAVHYRCVEEDHWYPDMEDIRSKITDRTKGIVVINPNNPTGALYPRQVLEEIVDVARQHGLVIFADEIYDHYVFDDKEHVAIASLAPDLLTVCINGISKSHRVAGFRCG